MSHPVEEDRLALLKKLGSGSIEAVRRLGRKLSFEPRRSSRKLRYDGKRGNPGNAPFQITIVTGDDATLGIRIGMDVHMQAVKGLALEETPLLILGITPDSAAARGGQLKAGDCLLSVNGEKVNASVLGKSVIKELIRSGGSITQLILRRPSLITVHYPSGLPHVRHAFLAPYGRCKEHCLNLRNVVRRLNVDFP
ncbi:MAG: hypothetical protein SGPRY_001388 [Prymnesium sp.]